MTLCIQKLTSTKYFLQHKRYLFTTINNFHSNTKHEVESSHIKYEALPNTKSTSKNNFKGPGLKDFINVTRNDLSKVQKEANIIPYLQSDMSIWGEQRKVFFEVYGCQMNVNDTEVVWSILKSSGFIKTDDINKADVILLITCAIREGAETKIWNRLKHLSAMKRGRSVRKSPLQVGLLGCMAERLKTQLLEREQTVDLVAGPDSYKDLPRLLAITRGGPRAANILLSLDETYADIMPVRLNEGAATAFVSIMRGCDNMCSYCIVPFTRGRERSRPVASILDEIRALAEQGVKEITLLGQNVNSYRDLSSGTSHFVESGNTTTADDSTRLAKGFKTVYKNKAGGVRFAELLQKVSETVPDVRIRFTSPHPKDFPDEVLQTIHDNRNICRNLHLPAQSGSTAVLERMRRGYTREAYLELASRARSLLPGLALSSDFICGFCGETEHDFKETLSLIDEVGYHVAYLFAYSMREKTTAHRRYTDDVPADVKNLRLREMAQVYRKGAQTLMEQYLGADQLVLVEGPSKRSPTEYYGRNDANIKVIFPIHPIQSEYTPAINNQESNNTGSPTRPIQTGDFIVVKITSTNSQVMRGIPLYHTSLKCYNNTITV